MGSQCLESKRPVAEGYFLKELTPIIKGIAIILMFAVHLLKTKWMTYPEMVVDFKIGALTLSDILARGGDICVGMFAFITGYGWSIKGGGENKLRQSFGVGSVYWLYWLVLILFAFPMRILMALLSGNGFPAISSVEILKSLFALESESVKFQWYIYFYVLALFTYPWFNRATKAIHCGFVMKMIGICLAFLLLRLGLRALLECVWPSEDVMSVVSHYGQWMPVVMIGSAVRENEQSIAGRFQKPVFMWAAPTIYFAKVLFQYMTGLYSGFDSFIIFPFMVGIIELARRIHDCAPILNRVLSCLGKFSMYMWLTHRIMLFQPFQRIMSLFRFPVIMLMAALAIMLPVSMLLSNIDMRLRTACLADRAR